MSARSVLIHARVTEIEQSEFYGFCDTEDVSYSSMLSALVQDFMSESDAKRVADLVSVAKQLKDKEC